MAVVRNEKNDLIPIRTTTGWRICIDYRRMNDATRTDHYPLPFMDQTLERLAGQSFYCFLNGYSGYNQIVVDPNVVITGANTSLVLRMLNAFKHSSSNINTTSLLSKLLSGLTIFEKSLINRR